jgi:DNA (cytosine-5)-methyltransferase 1
LQRDSEESEKARKRASENAEGCVGADDREVGGFDGYNGVLTGNVSSTFGVNCDRSTGRNGVIVRVDKKSYGVISIENHSGDSRVNIDESGKVQTLTSRIGTGGGNVPMIMEAVGIDCYNQAVTGDKAKSLTSGATDSDHVPCVAIDRAAFNQGINAMYDIGIDENGVAFTCVAKGPGAVAYEKPVIGEPQYIVRRLTPLECERLQGYPDYWTDIGEYIDSNGKKKQSSDSARYKALGNSIALPPWKWVLKRLCSHYERDATLLSLFDGIGGFPLIWEGLNGKGTCLFASEIEEFPIAVTKARIG